MKATIGRIVHFYDRNLENAAQKVDGNAVVRLNGQGAGPYPALVLQTFEGPYINLLVHGWGGDWREGSVSEYDAENNNARYWVWPPRE